MENSSSLFHHSVLLKNYKRISKLGEGNFSDVILIETLPEKQLIALKRLKINIHDDPLKLLNEVKLLKSLDHPNIIKCYDYQKEMIRISIAIEYCNDGDLSRRIFDAQTNLYHFKESLILKWVSQLFLAIEYLHHHHILHRDIKPQNIFLMKSGLLKIGDFGIAKELENDEDFTKTKLGTPYYLAPEICLGRSYSYPADIWMAGIVVYELMTLKKPFEEKSLHAVVNKIVQEDFPEIEEVYDEELKNLVKKMLEKNPEKRISIKEILKNPLIKIEIEKVKTEFDCYEKLEGERSRQVSFQQYLKDKMQKEDSPKEITKTEINQYSSLKNKENVKTLSRWSSLPAKTFEIFNFFNSNDENKKCISRSAKMDKEKYDAEFINKTTSHFEDFLQSKKGEINFASKTKNFPKISQVSTYKKNIETFFPFLKEMNINETFFEDIFCCKKFEKNEFITKIKEMCCESVDSNTILLLYEHYEKILSCHFDINNNKL